MSPLEAWLEEVEARTQAATEGPWEWDEHRPDDWRVHRPDGFDGCWWIAEVHEGGPEKRARANATFIASARSDVPRLCAELRASLKRETALREALGFYADKANFNGTETPVTHGCVHGLSAIEADGGKRARAALEQTR